MTETFFGLVLRQHQRDRRDVMYNSIRPKELMFSCFPNQFVRIAVTSITVTAPKHGPLQVIEDKGRGKLLWRLSSNSIYARRFRN